MAEHRAVTTPIPVMTAPAAAIETRGLGKSYRGGLWQRAFAAVEALDLSVPCGQVFGFLGPNGAGKTTTIMMLLGNVRPSRGRGWLLGQPIGNLDAKRRLGFLPEKFQFHDFLQADEFLELHGKLYGMPPKRRRSPPAPLPPSWSAGRSTSSSPSPSPERISCSASGWGWSSSRPSTSASGRRCCGWLCM